jgi:uncharacterized protein
MLNRVSQVLGHPGWLTRPQNLTQILALNCLLLISLWGVIGWPQSASATSLYEMSSRVDPSTWVVDIASQIPRPTESQLSSQLRQLAETTGQEVRFVTIHRLDYGETAQSFADKLFEKWFPEADDQANQTLIALDDITNEAGIHVGSAAATQLLSSIADSVAQDNIKQALQRGASYSQSLLSASDRIVAVLSGQSDPGAPVVASTIDAESTFASAEKTEENRSNSTIWVVVLLVLATVIPMATYYWYVSMGG